MAKEYKVDTFADVERLQKMFVDLNEKIRRRVATKAARAGASVIRNDARRRAKKIDDKSTDNNISRNIAITFSSSKARKYGDFTMRVGVRGGAKTRAENQQNPGGDTFYWRFLELGTKHIRARPFLLPAMETNAQKVFQAFTDKFESELAKEILILR